MQSLRILNTREIKRIKQALQEEFGHSPQEKYAYLQNEKEKIFIITKDIARIDLAKLKIDKVGLYFAELRNSQLRLSKEGAQLLARDAEKHHVELKNTVPLNEQEVKHYFRGNELEKDLGGENRLILLQFRNDILGCARYKEGKILNFLPKIHRGEVIV